LKALFSFSGSIHLEPALLVIRRMANTSSRSPTTRNSSLDSTACSLPKAAAPLGSRWREVCVNHGYNSSKLRCAAPLHSTRWEGCKIIRKKNPRIDYSL